MGNMNGLDVSGYQPGDILARVDFDFAWVKATEGTDYVSGVCDQQIQDARRRGKKYGPYHFASGGDANAEADYFAKNIQGYIGEGLPVLDFEAGAVNRGGGWALQFLQRFQSNTGIKALIYTSESVASRSDMKQIADADFGLWNANWGSNPSGGYENAPSSSGSGQWPFAIARQYSSNGDLGYGGRVDLDVFFGDASVWDAYAKSDGSHPVPPPTPAPPSKAPAYPLPSGYYYGPRSGPVQSVSGYVGPYGGPNGAPGLRTWQQQMKNRGNSLAVDGLYGDETARIAGNFQKQCGLWVDKLIGPDTWAAAWNAPVTSQPL